MPARPLSLVLLVLMMPAGCAVPPPAGPTSYPVDFAPPAEAPSRTPMGALVFVIDGVNADIFNEMLHAGELPNLKRYIVDRGLYCPRTIANIPSITLVNLTAIATGAFPGRSTIVGNHWFDRDRLMWRDYATIAQKNAVDGDHAQPLIYQYLPDDEMSVSIFFQPHRGASKFFENWTSAGPAFFFGWYGYVDRLSLYRLGEMMDLARQRGQFPRLVMTYQLWPDFAAYGHGTSHEVYRHAIRHADLQVGRICEKLAEANLLDRMVLAFVSDHSHSDIHTHWVLEDALAKEGFVPARRRLHEADSPSARARYYDDHDLVVAISGDRGAGVYLRAKAEDGSPLPWSAKPSPNRLAKLGQWLLKQPAVDVVAWNDATGRTIAANTRGRILLAPDPAGGTIRLSTPAGDDPFGYGLAEANLPPQQWLERTIHSDYPDLPVQLPPLLHAGVRAADLYVFARPGFDFRTEHSGGHGGVRAREDMLVPMGFAGPGVPNGITLPQARSVDLTPTILQLLGVAPPSNIDGRSLLADH
jgi:predicted AlkP superfamily pyrophosphatase or phosphodiesterase